MNAKKIKTTGYFVTCSRCVAWMDIVCMYITCPLLYMYMFSFQNVLNHFIFIKVRVAMYMYTVFSIQATHQLSAICFIL